MSNPWALDELHIQVEELTDELTDAHKRIDALQAMLDEVRDWLDQRADADHDGDRFVANPEMRLMMAVEEVLCK